ncbi:GLUG motif-containing protein, partial [Sphingomonas azotifigens]|uniref:GLUG motif-containing protein n=1 Tax=Sphingomonas azotifigens TaxID=330920 RepID=UPI0014313275
MLAGLATPAAHAQTLPSGGSVVAGSASIVSGNGATTIHQTSDRAIINWSDFSIGQGGAVTFDNGSGATLNRVTGTQISQIDGRLSGTGSVYLINANGIVVGKTGVVETGGTFVGSTLDVADAAFLRGGSLEFTGTARASVINLGKVGALGGNVALIGMTVVNQGEIGAANGSALLAAGSRVLLRDTANDAGGLISVLYGDAATSVANGGLIRAASAELHAQQGNVYALAGNSAGTINATGVRAGQGKVWLVSDAGTTKVAGTITAQGAGGTGGFVETSGHVLDIGTASVTAAGGKWLLDPIDLTLTQGMADALSQSLNGGTDVEIYTNDTDSSYGYGDYGDGNITVTGNVAWSSSAKLTLNAWNNIAINAVVDAGATGNVSLLYGQGAAAAGNAARLTFGAGGKLNLPAGNTLTTKLGSDGQLTNWLVLTALGQENSYSDGSLQGLVDNSPQNIAIGADIDASATAGWNGGFKPFVGFSGIFEGLGHTIQSLTINRPNGAQIGLFANLAGTVRNLNLTDVAITGDGNVGSLVGSAASGSVIQNVSASGTVNGGRSYGGLVGYNQGTIDQSHAGVNVTGGYSAGGLVGTASGGSITRSYATGNVSGSKQVGGLVGLNGGTLDQVYATGAVAGSDQFTGGLVGVNGGPIRNAFASGAVTGTKTVGGLVGFNQATLSQSYATGTVTATGGWAGGLVGSMPAGTIDQVFATGTVINAGSASSLGGLVGQNGNGTITNAYWNTSTAGVASGVGSGNDSGVSGLTTAQLAAALPAGFDSAVWGNANNATTPYLNGFGFAPISGSVLLGNDASATPMRYNMLLSVDQLQAVNQNLQGNFVLGTDLSFDYPQGNGSNFAPIGQDTAFSGTFEGLGHTISGLVIARSDDKVGLFGWNQGTIRNVSLERASVEGNNLVGGLVGLNSGGVIGSSVSNGSVRGFSVVGGLAGSNDGTITQSSVFGSTTVRASTESVGGLVGANTGAVSVSYADSRVSGSSAGGLVGLNSGSIAQSYAIGTVGGYDAIGGLVGRHDGGTVSQSYAAATVGGYARVGGLIGEMDGDATLSQAFSLSRPDGSGGSFNGLIGERADGAAVTAAYWNTSASGTDTGVGTGGTSGISGLTNAEMASALPAGFSAGAWANGGNMMTPYLLSHAGMATGGPVFLRDAVFDTSGSGTPGSPPSSTPGSSGPSPLAQPLYGVITTVAHLSGIDRNLYGSYVLGNDIDASVTRDWNGGAGFLPIGTHGSFAGVLDGAGHTIRDLTIAQDGGSRVGLFNTIGGDGLVSNLTLSNVNIRGAYYVGALAGYNYGTIRDVAVSGSVTGAANGHGSGQEVGGLVGGSSGTIANSHSDATVAGFDTVGGLVGVLDGGGTIENSSATGSVTGRSSLGGLVGFAVTGARISGSSATGRVEGVAVTIGGDTYSSNAVGGFVGASDAAISNSFATGNVSGGTAVGGFAGNWGEVQASGIHASGAVTGEQYVGGLIGYADSGSLRDSFATGTVTGVRGDASSQTYAIGGLVGYSSIDITNAHADGAVSGDANVGGLIGIANRGSILDAYANGAVTGDAYVGGLIGWQSDEASVQSAFATGAVSGVSDQSRSIGGFVGMSYGSISDAFATGAVSTGISVGGFVGDQEGGGIVRSYASGAVRGSDSVGGFAGMVQLNAPISNQDNVWDMTASGQTAASQGGSMAGVTGLTTEQMHSAASFANWSIDSVGGSQSATWRIYEGATGPLLKSFLTRATVTSGGTTVYDGTVQSGSTLITLDGGVSADRNLVYGTATTSCAGGNCRDVGSYSVGYTGGLYSGPLGYDLVAGDASTLTITPRALTVTYTAGTVSRTYGDVNPAFTGTVSADGLVAGDALTGTASWASDAGVRSNVGSYGVTGSGIGASSNYTLTSVQADSNATALTINPRALTVTYTAGTASRSYGDANPTLTGTVSADGLVNGDALTGTAGWASDAGVRSNVGSYGVIGSGIGASSNYTLTSVQADGNATALTINPRGLTVTYAAGTASRTYGDANPALTGTVSADGLVNGDALTGTAGWASDAGV